MLEKPNDNGASPVDLDRSPGGIHNQNPHDLLGGMTRTNLTANVLLAAVLTFAALALLSVGPYLYGLAASKEAKTHDEKPAAAETAATPRPEPAKKQPPAEAIHTNPDPLEKQPAPEPVAGKPPKGPDPLDKLGVSETKTTDPRKNPLDKGSDDLLKDIK
jgi:hypothetical protein